MTGTDDSYFRRPIYRPDRVRPTWGRAARPPQSLVPPASPPSRAALARHYTGGPAGL